MTSLDQFFENLRDYLLASSKVEAVEKGKRVTCGTSEREANARKGTPNEAREATTTVLQLGLGERAILKTVAVHDQRCGIKTDFLKKRHVRRIGPCVAPPQRGLIFYLTQGRGGVVRYGNGTERGFSGSGQESPCHGPTWPASVLVAPALEWAYCFGRRAFTFRSAFNNAGSGSRSVGSCTGSRFVEGFGTGNEFGVPGVDGAFAELDESGRLSLRDVIGKPSITGDVRRLPLIFMSPTPENQ